MSRWETKNWNVWDSWTLHRRLFLNIRSTIMEIWKFAGHGRPTCLKMESSFDQIKRQTLCLVQGKHGEYDIKSPRRERELEAALTQEFVLHCLASGIKGPGLFLQKTDFFTPETSGTVSSLQQMYS